MKIVLISTEPKLHGRAAAPLFLPQLVHVLSVFRQPAVCRLAFDRLFGTAGGQKETRGKRVPSDGFSDVGADGGLPGNRPVGTAKHGDLVGVGTAKHGDLVGADPCRGVGGVVLSNGVGTGRPVGADPTASAAGAGAESGGCPYAGGFAGAFAQRI